MTETVWLVLHGCMHAGRIELASRVLLRPQLEPNDSFGLR